MKVFDMKEPKVIKAKGVQPCGHAPMARGPMG